MWRRGPEVAEIVFILRLSGVLDVFGRFIAHHCFSEMYQMYSTAHGRQAVGKGVLTTPRFVINVLIEGRKEKIIIMEKVCT